ncbi:MAG: glycosyltransferase family 39 protein [Chloroflexi bacterium]|nr:glycosyltransferase family 39 protein [Chloroflexota bacterium]
MKPQSTFTTLHKIILIVLFMVAIGIRMYDFDDPPLDFHPARQLHSALMARGFYLDTGGNLPRKTAEYMHEAMMRGMQEPWIEPPIMERITAYAYQLAGDADLRIPRGIAIFFWILGGVGLAFLAAGSFSSTGVIALCAFYLFFPYNVIASRSFQPEPLMLCLIIWGLYALVSWLDRPGFWRALLAGVLIGLAILVKQVAVFPLALAGFAMIISQKSFRSVLKRPDFWIFIALVIIPVAAYNIWGIWGAGFLRQQFQGRFFLAELINPAFYIRWIRMIDQVFAVAFFILTMLGLLVVKNSKLRAICLGYMGGYLLYGLVLPHHIGTHDYYQLLIMPVVAIGFGSMIDAIYERLKTPGWLPGILLAGLCGWWLADSVITMNRQDYRAWPERWQTLTPMLEPYSGQINTIGIMEDYGAGMIYWGLKTPMIWDTPVEALPASEADQRIRSAMINREYLMVTDLSRFYTQVKLQRWLNENAELVSSEPDYLIYRMDLNE